MGYKNDQFFETGQNEIWRSYVDANGKPISPKNPPFNYPSKTIRVSQFNDVTKKWEPQTYKLQRGYIRSLSDYAATSDTSSINLPIVKCNFQFNPEYITHNVEMSTRMQPILLQDPSQLTAPIPGNTSFSFELTFDRSYTLNHESDSFDAADLGTPTEKNIGVLADLRALYAVIGQGISKDTIELSKQVAQSQLTNELTEESTDTATNTDFARQATDAVTSYFSANDNMGNNAFLIPLPVRVVFSSLFMVDGFVTSTEVVYTKFSRTLVPMTCTVVVSMDALYVGFARERTFLTANLESTKKASQGTITENIAKAKEIISVFEQNINKIDLRAYTIATGDYNVGVNRSINVNAVDGYLVSNDKFTSEFVERTTGSGIKGTTSTVQQCFDVDIREGSGYNKDQAANTPGQKEVIKQAFESNSAAVKMNLILSLYGPFSQTDANTLTAFIKTKDQTLLSNSDQATKASLMSKLVSETRLSKPTITSWDDWEDFRKGTNDKNFADKVMHDNSLSNQVLSQLESQNKYFVAALSGSVTPIVSNYTNGVLLFFSNAQSIKLDGDNSKINLSLDFDRRSTD